MNASFSNALRTLLGILFLILVGVISFVLGRGLHESQAPMLDENGYPVVGDAPMFPVDVPTKEPEPEPVYVDPGVESTLSIAWLPLDQQDDVSQKIPYQIAQYFYDTQVSWDPTNPAFVRELGVVSSGDYEGYSLLFFGIPQEGLGIYYVNMYVLRPPNAEEVFGDVQETWRLLLRPMAVDDLGWSTMDRALAQRVQNYPSKDGIEADATTDITELAFHSKIVRTSSGMKFLSYKLSDRRVDAYHVGGDVSVFPVNDYPIRATLEDGTVLRLYTVPEGESAVRRGEINSLFSVRKDGRLIWYDVVIPFWDEVTPPRDRNSGVPQVFLNGESNTDMYIKGEVGGCGFINTINVVQPEDIGELVVIGSYVDANNERQDIYGPKDFTLAHFQDAFTTWKSYDETRTFEAFKATIPFFYYKDQLGRWIEFANAEIVPAVECGKPVIYLYPETTRNLRVEVEPRGGFTFTEPEYNGGWNVTAEPDGTLTNLPDGKVYPYLFWEGRGGLYEKPSHYWVVAQADVHTFLVTTLAKLGLNEKESADFIEFWEPRMQDSPYYRVGFHGTETMDEIAPLTISEKPDAILRILMDFDGLEAWESSNPPKRLPSFERKGFTVVEWGGVIQ